MMDSLESSANSRTGMVVPTMRLCMEALLNALRRRVDSACEYTLAVLVRRAASQAVWKKIGWRRDDGLPDLESDLLVRCQHDRARIAVVGLPVHERMECALEPGAFGRGQRHPPDVEEIPESVLALVRRLDVDDARCVMRVQPVEAVADPNESAVDTERPHDADSVRDGDLPAVVED